ncbi:MAG: polyphosphate kinase 1 [Crocinitomicaceae bacterium]|nr:polyphosphate kinase 1 [Crocinitomicaceae bacterium]
MEKLVNRELSWLSFNERVLQESLDRATPLIERLRFLGIYSNNMDEFFRVRVANINRLVPLKEQKLDGFEGSAKDLLNAIQDTVKKQRKIYDLSYQRLLKEMESHGIFHINEETIPDKIKEQLTEYYHEELKRDIVPIMLDKKHKFPRLQDKEIYLATTIVNEKKGKARYALIQVPSAHPRFLTFKDDDKDYVMLLDDIIRLFLYQIFSIFEFESISAFTFKFTRDAELNLDDDISISMYDKMEHSIKQRKKGEPVRFIYDEQMPKDLLKYLKEAIGISEIDHTAPSGRYHNFKDLMKFPDFGRKEFIFPKQSPVQHPGFSNSKSILKSILEKDYLLHYPYQKFDHLVDFLREAAIDPKVRAIKINIYRVASRSQVINALINAVKNGKDVTVVVELQARFDEENNMYWSNVLREHGAKIIYGVPGLKVHSKLIQVTRFSGKKEHVIAHIGTGNFHGGTAKVYTDYSLFTAKPEITREIKKVFNLMENNIERGTYRNLLVSPFNTRRKFSTLINNEIKNAKKGLPASIDIKINNLVDNKLIAKLYEASNAGVNIRAIIRGVCCLVPGIPGQSENIEIISIVGRYLEHTRVIIFHNNGAEQFYISSADWMTRNLEKRIEVTTPILQDDIKANIRNVFELQWKDNVKARMVDNDLRNRHVKPQSGDEIIDAQEALYKYYMGIS